MPRRACDETKGARTGQVVLKDSWDPVSRSKGWYYWDRRLILTAHGGPSDGKTVTFEYYDPY